MKNKKGIIIVVILALLIIGLAVVFLNKKNSGKEQSSTNTPTQQSPLTFTSMKDLLSKSLSMQCTFTTEKGLKAETYIKNGAVRSNYLATKPEESQSSIIKDSKMYSWNDTTKQGIMMTFDLEKITPPATISSGPRVEDKNTSPYNTLQEIEKFKNACKPAVVNDSLFTPPSDIKFINLLQQMNDLKSKTAAPKSGAGTVNEEQLQKMIEQYSGGSGNTSQPAE